ncbi:MAG: hypothetical protein IJ087_19230 [Eggerthellaceae bacterium]|nr:hypothetical protein [Eggerthellaceae bacterium]
MGSYDDEMKRIEQGIGERGDTARAYFAALDAGFSEEESFLKHRPDYSKTLFAPENDDIYQEFCRFIDMPEPRYFDMVDNPMRVEGFTAADVYYSMKSKNDRIVSIDAAAVYAMLVNLRDKPQLYKKVLDFRPTCYQGGCGMKDAAFDAGYYGERTFPKA